MLNAEQAVRTLAVVDARGQWETLLAAVSAHQQQVLIEKDGVAVAALVSPADFQRLRRLEAQRAAEFAVIDRMRAAFAGVPDDELEREITRAVAEARAELRAERANQAGSA